MTLSTFIYLSLAAWRLASLVANEDGPWMMFKRFRTRAEQWCMKYPFCRDLNLYDLLACEWCNSVWIGAVLTVLYLLVNDTILYIALPFAFSTVTIVIKYIVEILQNTQTSLEQAKRSTES
jgi:hypothetical protein